MNKKANDNTVNSYKNNISTVNSKTLAEKIDDLLEEEKTTPEGIAKVLSEQLDDIKSESYYIILANENRQGRLFEALSITKDAYNRGIIKTNKAVYFQGILKRWGLKTKFKNT